MFYTTKNRNRDIIRRIRQKGKGFGLSPSRKRKIKKYLKSKRRKSTKKRAQGDHSVHQTFVRNRSRDCETTGHLQQDLSTQFRENLAATIIQGAFRRAQFQKRVCTRLVNALLEHVEPLDALEIDIRCLLDFVNSSFAHIVDCSPLKSQYTFLHKRLMEVNFYPVPRGNTAHGNVWDDGIQCANRCLSMLWSINTRLNGVIQTRRTHSKTLMEEIEFMDKIHRAQAKMIRQREAKIGILERTIYRQKLSIKKLIDMIPDPEDEPPAFEDSDFAASQSIPVPPPPSPV